jgi:hypothetical protein
MSLPNTGWQPIPGTSIDLCWSVRLQAEIPVLIVSLRGEGAPNTERRKVADAISKAVTLACQTMPEPEVAVLDSIAIVDPDFFRSFGKSVGCFSAGFGGRAWLWAANEDCAAPLQSWFGHDQVAFSLEQALETLAQRRIKGSFEVSDPIFGEQHSYQWTERGYVETFQDKEGEQLISLWFRTHLIERIKQNPDQTECWKALWPFPDGLQQENEACRRRARLVLERGHIREVDFNPTQTKQPLPTNWIDLISDLQELEELDLLGTGVSDQEVMTALSKLPKLQRLRLDNTDITEVSEWIRSPEGASFL